jgi:hypothetical protein
MITASDASVGQKYKTPNGILVEVVEKTPTSILVKSFDTGHNVPVPLNYQLTPVTDAEEVVPEPCKIINLEEKTMSETLTPAVEAPKGRKIKKSNIVDEGLKTGLSVEEITKNVLAAFPETQEKSVRNLVSVRRSKLKKPV